MQQGWIKLHRKIQDDVFWKESREFSKLEAWLDILLEVQHSETQSVILGFQIFKVERGESLKSYSTWASRWNWTLSKTKRYFNF